MDRSTTHLYEILGVPKTSTQDEIKKAYRYSIQQKRMAWENSLHFLDCYESDPTKRSLYDKYGMMGVQMANTELGAQLAAIENLLGVFLCTLSMLLILGLIFLSFLAVRVDGKVDWNYAVVFIPLWILSAIIIGGLILQLRAPIELDDDEDDEDHRHEHDGSDGGSSTRPMAQEDRREKKRKRMERLKRAALSVRLLNISLFTLFEVFIVRKANDPTSMSATAVFAPYFALEGVHFLIDLVKLWVAFQELSAHSVPLSSKLNLAFEELWWDVVRTVQAVLIMLRVDSKIVCSWHLVFLPLYLCGVKYLVQIILMWRKFSTMQTEELRQQGKSVVLVSAIAFVVVGSLAYSMLALLASRLDGHSYRVSTVMIPLFIVLGILLCCSGCCLPCMLFTSRIADDDIIGREDAEVRVVSPNLRIENGSSQASSSRSGSRR
ncbi:hypothetical protein BGZ73_000059 [Actinomortierella ambigua]|nr:hypothetical protein BGZ73_000059 [Actinomortierella ambigua]